MIGCGDCILAAIVCVSPGDAFTLQATIQCLASPHPGEAVEWANQQYNCQQTDNDLDAAPHFYFQPTTKFDVRDVTFVSQFHGKPCWKPDCSMKALISGAVAGPTLAYWLARYVHL